MEVCTNAAGPAGPAKTGAWINGASTCTEAYLKPIYKHGEVILEVECGDNKGLLYLSRLCQGSRGPCIFFGSSFLTPNEFQYVSGRETAKDWKRSIRHHGKSIKLLLSKGLLCVHPTVCDCRGCKTNGQMQGRRSSVKRNAHREFKYDISLFPRNESTTSIETEEKHSVAMHFLPCNKNKSRTNKLSQIIENLRHSREKENVSERAGESDDSGINYSAQVHFQDMRRSPSSSPNLVYTPTIEQLNWTPGFARTGNVHSYSPRNANPWSWNCVDRTQHHDDVTPLDLSVKKLKPNPAETNPKEINLIDRDQDSSHDLPDLNNSHSTDGHHRKSPSRCHSQSPPILPRQYVDRSPRASSPPTTGTYQLKVPSLTNSMSIQSVIETKERVHKDDVDKAGIETGEMSSDGGDWKDGNECFAADKSYAMDSWDIDDVAQFVRRSCDNEHVMQKFRDQHVDGKSLRLLTVDHLVGVLTMKLGPAVRLRSEISKECGKCETCHHCLHCHDGKDDSST